MKTIKNAAFAVILIAAIPVPVMAVDWEANITALTSTSAKNRISFGQRSDATDGFDGQYEVPAYVEGDISACFPHTDWGETATKYWRDIKAPDRQKSWVFIVESGLNLTTIRLSWDSLQIPQGFTAILVDDTTGASADMTTQGVYIYTNTGPRQFTINTEAPQEVTYLEAPTDLKGSYVSGTGVVLTWTDNSTGEDGFVIERKVGGQGTNTEWAEIGVVGADTTTFMDQTVDPASDDSHIYRVKDYNSLTESDYSNSKPVKLQSKGGSGGKS